MAFERRRPTPLALLTQVQPMISASPPQFAAGWGEFAASECAEHRSTLSLLRGLSAACLKFAAAFSHHAPAFAGGIRTVSQNRRTDFRLLAPVRRSRPQRNSKTPASNLTTTPQIFECSKIGGGSPLLHFKSVSNEIQMSFIWISREIHLDFKSRSNGRGRASLSKSLR